MPKVAKIVGRSTLILLAVPLGACGGSPEEETASSEAERAYPYVMADGAVACSDGRALGRNVEYYYFDKLNETLSESPEFAAIAWKDGLDVVDSCETARLYGAILEKQVLLDSEAQVARRSLDRQGILTGSLPDNVFRAPLPPDSPPGTEPLPDDDKVDKIGDGVDIAAKFVANIGNTSTVAGCSGVLIGAQWMLTAAHCFSRDFWQPLTITMGNSPGGTRISFGDNYVLRHPYWNGLGASGTDIALVWSSGWSAPANSPLSWKHVWGGVIQVDKNMFIYGYGRNSHNGTGGGLRRRSARIVNTDSVEPKSLFAFQKSLIGFRAEAGEGRPCKGDSGGPAITLGFPEFDYVGGVASFSPTSDVGPGENCPNTGGWFYYTQVAGGGSFMNCATGGTAPYTSCWIQDTINTDPDTTVGCTRWGGTPGRLQCW